MIVCSCNVLSDHEIRAALNGEQIAPQYRGNLWLPWLQPAMWALRAYLAPYYG